MSKKIKVYAAESNIPGIGNGLFAAKKILKGDIIAEFKGKLLDPGSTPTDPRSNILFSDGCILQCTDGDLASYANDLIVFPTKKRSLLGSLIKKRPFYNKHPDTHINAIIVNKTNEHRSFLKAIKNIQPGDEIYVHYGFMYWIMKEYCDIGFLDEVQLSKAAISVYPFQYDAFFEYVKVFYPKYASHEIVKIDEEYHNVILYADDDSYYNAIMVGVMEINC